MRLELHTLSKKPIALMWIHCMYKVQISVSNHLVAFLQTLPTLGFCACPTWGIPVPLTAPAWIRGRAIGRQVLPVGKTDVWFYSHSRSFTNGSCKSKIVAMASQKNYTIGNDEEAGKRFGEEWARMKSNQEPISLCPLRSLPPSTPSLFIFFSQNNESPINCLSQCQAFRVKIYIRFLH